jgi:hypothetical protein
MPSAAKVQMVFDDMARLVELGTPIDGVSAVFGFVLTVLACVISL